MKMHLFESVNKALEKMGTENKEVAVACLCYTKEDTEVLLHGDYRKILYTIANAMLSDPDFEWAVREACAVLDEYREEDEKNKGKKAKNNKKKDEDVVIATPILPSKNTMKS